jgi:hypothetical protein
MDATGGTTIQTGDKIFNIGVINNATFGTVVENMAFNEYLTRELMNAIKPHCPIAAKYLDLVKSKPEWYQLADLSNKAKEIIAANYVGVIGTQLRKLVAIGKEPISDGKQQTYIDTCILTAKRTIQIICFALLSDFWNKKNEKDYPLSAEQKELVTRFFENWIELDFKEFVSLLSCLFMIYKDNGLQLPISELTEFAVQLQGDSIFMKACEKLETISETPDKDRYTISNCSEAEISLTNLLAIASFFSVYKMVSIKNVGYEEERNTKPKYLHNFVALGYDSKTNTNIDRLNYLDKPISTDAILLYKSDYLTGINLFPFVIDINALTFEGGVKICFFSSLDMDDNNMNYCFLEDNTMECVTFSDVLSSGTLINELMEDKEKRKKLKLDSVFHLFRNAKSTILEQTDSIDLSALDDYK